MPDRKAPAGLMLDRRKFLAGSAKAAALAATLTPTTRQLLALGADPNLALFPEKFAWGASTSAMQVEGYPYADGGGRSVWSVLDNDPAKVKDGSNDLITDDTYHLGLHDIPLMNQLGINSYRLSIGWPRVLPEGRGPLNNKALAYYDRLLDGLLHAGITPWVTVYHFDYPEALQKQGGWLHEDSPKWLADYAHLLAARYSDRIGHWFTINEPNIFWSFSSEAGLMPPATKLSREQLVLGAHNILRGHGLSVQAIRAAAKKPVNVGLAFAGQFSLPATNSRADIEAARTRSFTVEETKLGPTMPPLSMLGNAWWLDAIYLGKYPEDGLKLFPTAAKLATPGAMATIHQPLDFCAINLYFGPHVRAGADGKPEEVTEPADAPRSHYGWLITPELLYWGPKWLHERYGKPVVITENGMARADQPGPDGKVHDPERAAFLHDYLRNYLRASSEGVPLLGYFHWSLLDNWEFQSGFSEQFGLIYVDHKTQVRTFKDSARLTRKLFAAAVGRWKKAEGPGVILEVFSSSPEAKRCLASESDMTLSSRCGALLGCALVLAAGSTGFPQGQPVTIHVDVDKPSGTYHPVWNYFGADEPNYTYAPNGARLLGELSAINPAVPVYFRPHNLLTTGDGQGSLKWGSTNVYTEEADGSPVYDWAITDRLFDNLKATHVRPMVEIGFMPEALSPHPEPYRHAFPGKGAEIFTGWSFPPRDYAKWRALLVAWVGHLHARYGNDVDTWQWEVWNEPDIPYFHGSVKEYEKLYDVSTAAVREVLPHAMVGGPAVTGPVGSTVFLEDFLEHCARGINADSGKVGAPLDFISFHPKGEPKFESGYVRMNLGRQLRATDLGMQVVARYPEYRNTPIILSETDPEGCAACQGPQNGYRNGPLYGASVAEMLARSSELARLRGVNLLGAVTWAFEFEDQPWFAGFRELATNGVDKPVLNVFRMYGMLGGSMLPLTSSAGLSAADIEKSGVVSAPDVNGLATRQGKAVDILLWNYHDEDVPAAPSQIVLEVAGIGATLAHVIEYRMDADYSNAYATWLHMGSPQHPSEQQIAEMRKSGGLQILEEKTIQKKRSVPVKISLKLPRQGVSLYHLTW